MTNNVEQLAKKVSMNSIYGGLAQRGGYLGLEEAGATITAVGRQLVQKAAKWLEEHDCEIMYGDCVTGNTLILIRCIEGHFARVLEEVSIAGFFDAIRSPPVVDFSGDPEEKDYKLVGDFEAWTETGWTQITHIMRHLTTKAIYGVQTTTSYVQVTEDHSLLLADGTSNHTQRTQAWRSPDAVPSEERPAHSRRCE